MHTHFDNALMRIQIIQISSYNTGRSSSFGHQSHLWLGQPDRLSNAVATLHLELGYVQGTSRNRGSESGERADLAAGEGRGGSSKQ